MIKRSSAHNTALPGTPGPGHTHFVLSRTVTVLILLLLLLSACGGGEDAPQEAAEAPAADAPVTAEDMATTAPPPTAESSATPLPSPTTPPTPTTAPSPTPDLAAGFVPLTYDDLGLSLSAPADWHAESLIDLVLLASSEELIDAPDIGSEGAVMVVAAGPTADMVEELDTRDPLVALSTGFEDLGFGQQTELVEGPTAATIDGLPAAVARYEAVSDTDVPLAGIMVLIIGDNRSAVAFGAAPRDSAEQYLPLMEVVATSIELSQEVAVVEEEEGEEDPVLSIDGTLFPGETVSGELAAGGRSSWLIFALADEIYDIRVNPLSGDLDIVLDVLDEAGQSILEGGPLDESFDDEEILDLKFDVEGLYTLVITGYEPEMSGEFEIELLPAQPAQESSATDSQAGIAYGETITAAFDGAGTLQIPFDGREGDIAQFVVTPRDDLDIVIDIVDAEGDSLVPAGHDNNGSGPEIAGARLPADGTYALLVSPFFGETEGEVEVMLVGPGGTEIIVPDAFTEDGEDHAFPFAAVDGDVAQLLFQPESDFESELGVYDSVTDGELIRLVRSPGAQGLGFAVTEDGDYYFLAAGFSAGSDSDSGAYTATLLGSEDVLFELAAGDSARGRFPDIAYGIGYQYFGSEGETIVVTVQTDEDSDAVIEVYDEEDDQLAYVDEAFSGETEVLTYTFDADGLVFIVITELDFFPGIFEMTLERG